MLFIARGRADDLCFFDCFSPFCWLLIEFHCTFSISYKYHIMFIIIVFRLGCDRPSGLIFFVPSLLLSIFEPLFLPSSPVSVLFRSCCSDARVFGKTLMHEFPMSYSHTECTFLFSRGEIVCTSAEASSIKMKSN